MKTETRHWFGGTETFSWERACACTTPGYGECKFAGKIPSGDHVEMLDVVVLAKRRDGSPGMFRVGDETIVNQIPIFK